MSDSILAKTVRGAGWTIGWRMLTRFLGVANTLILARLLVPGDFGLVALGKGFAQGILAFSSLGIDEAVIRQTSATRETYDTAFTINLIRGLATALLIAACAWPVSVFFKDPRLMYVLLAFAACAVVTSFENIGTIEFRRDFAFDKEFKLFLLPRLIAVAVTVVVAAIWRSHWALVAGIAAGQILGTGMGYVMHPYRPRPGLTAWRQLAGFSFWSWAISVATMLRSRVDGFVVGRLLDLDRVGVYAVGAELATMPTDELAGPLSYACFPGFAAATRSGTEFSTAYLRILACVMVITLPIGAGVSLVAAPVVVLALGPGWDGAIDIVRILGIAGAFMVPGTVTASLLSAYGLLRSAFLINIISTTVRTASCVALVSLYGLVGAAIAQALTILVESFAYLVVAFRQFRLRARDLISRVWRALFATLVMAMVLTFFGPGTGTASPLGSLCEAIAAGMMVYAVVLFGTWFVAGQPAGAERDLLGLLHRSLTGMGMSRWAALLPAGVAPER